MDDIENTENVDNQLSNEPVIDYKAEYEKIIAEKERVAAEGSFEEILKEKGYITDDENIKSMYEKLDNNTLQIVGDVLKVLKVDLTSVLRGKSPTIGITANIKSSKKPSFQDFINKK